MELCSGGELFDRIVARGHYTCAHRGALGHAPPAEPPMWCTRSQASVAAGSRGVACRGAVACAPSDDSAGPLLQGSRGAQRLTGLTAAQSLSEPVSGPAARLTDARRARPRGSEKDAAQLIRTIVSVVAHCHHLGVIHRCAAPAVPPRTLAPAAGARSARARARPGAAPRPSRGTCVCRVA